MRFPRTNLTGAEEISAEVEGEQLQEHAGEKPTAPIWQSNFSLAPNVRFTRTPENLINPKRVPAPPLALQERVAAEIGVSVEPPASVVANGPLEGYEAEIPPVIEVQPTAAVSPVSSVEPETHTIVRASTELASISDFAFWEVMAFEEAAAEPILLPPVVSLPKAEVSPESIISRFRVMEWRPARQQPAIAVAPMPEPVAPPPVAPAPGLTLTRATQSPAEAEQSRMEEAVVQPKTPPIAPLPVRTQAPQPLAPAPRFAAPKIVPSRVDASGYEFPSHSLLQEPPERVGEIMSQETLEQNAGLLESVLEDFGIKGEIIHVRPGPVVTLYEFEPAPGVKSSRVIGLADDIARSMSALSARVAVVPGRNVIGIELPNALRETVYFREMIESQDFEKSGYKLALGLGKTIGGEPVIAELAKMPHLLVAGTTGSGKSVAINTMILSLLYRMSPEQCRLIMVDPKMLELSVYDGIPHLLTPVVTDPKKAVMALKWAVREMEDRYRKMSRLGVRNIDGYNNRVAQARDKGEIIHVMVQTGFDRSTGAPIEEQQEMDLTPMPYIVVIVDEMADLMMVAGKDIEGAIQRLAQMARAAGIHLIMATQRPSVDVITGTIKANFPTRISFQVTSKIDSRTILGEQGAEQLLGQGDMLHMQGGGRISRVHGPFVSDAEVEKVVAHLKTQGRPEYLDTVTADEEEDAEEEDSAVFDKGDMAAEDGNDLYDKAVKVVLRDKKCSTSYIQRRLGIGYNRAASLVERMEKEGLVGPANHVGKREIVAGRGESE
ncbi:MULTISPECIES: DNA translocase FtsK [unclassified Rhizobium]|uniref:DNA translocase FtsK n=1 Tax=unclassified Rhizobium TaxID=2613769 RepID=UPI00104B3C9F|nr:MULTISPECIES: DNA translocase FtsK [unclassified Rhizobium]MBB3398344.1 S-DNA-T family DNA segregation ATPase FtsK/SpoIIIE [Rhizobium sp. BK060]MBB4166850.1 S-DNA-T family DNA segregation ATPase FtsK/SpoIIIE [Rhizobium sp. BK538]TCM67081.1 DNA translocase FtsK [Rhizobium sp. BK068]